MNTLLQLQAATLAARARLGDKRIGTRLKQGAIQVVRVTYAPNGKSSVEPVSDWLNIREAVKFLESL